jgi:hypothetical protein
MECLQKTDIKMYTMIATGKGTKRNNNSVLFQKDSKFQETKAIE